MADKTVIERLKQEIQNLSVQKDTQEVGVVRTVGDGIVEIEGLSGAAMAEMLYFDESSISSVEETISREGKLYGLALNLEEDTVKAIILGDSSRVQEGMVVKRTGNLLSIPVGENFIGRIINPLGDPVDGKGPIASEATHPIEREASGVIDRAPVDTPLHTGIKAIDALIPIGRGQRELIIGDRGTGKTTVAIDAIINQLNEPEETRPICIYVAIGQKESKTARIAGLLEERGAMAYTTIITAPASAPAAFQFLAPYAGAALGEHFMDKGRDVLVIYDDLSKQAVAYRQLSLLLRRPPGREAYPGDIFYLHSRLLERAAKLSPEKGGGSMTALPIIETQEGDISAYIPTNVISITDGQMFLEADLFNKGTRPAINVGSSVSRVGSAAQTKAMKQVAGRIKLDLAQFRELEAFMQFASDLDAETAKRIDTGKRLTGVLNQDKNAPIPFERQVVSIYAAINGFLDEFPPEEISTLEEKLQGFFDREHKAIFESIRTEKKITEENEAVLKTALEAFVSSMKS
ncbi:F0F1 ATP synthase subunit alpha [Candidatus Kaiserbacteria bacterium CG10_big_fil_rev_8_21_14_0_10_45_20]|uniref:ATP synthase subunit alpha n=1 Tax=Candidatus Kaiserbacteria bacterium CG10_big_fil_rev_8_21_14_0_10_45_20 TaxID=1974607 RepID=A0A2H0UGM6_9BACT|nr:MAG: F0F1 ATP synthase subunit alpha [Candidatus Kaiserbacteria bacterium CG10_big_fil_rev_8_21_14_0_10_45_20]